MPLTNSGGKTTNFGISARGGRKRWYHITKRISTKTPAIGYAGKRPAERTFSMNWPWKKKKLTFAETAKFNWEADTNAELRQKLNELAKQYPTLQESEYRRRLLELFRQQGLDINAEQLDMLLLLRQKTDQMLLERAAEKPESAT